MVRALLRTLLLALVIGMGGPAAARADAGPVPEVFVAFDRYHADLLLPRAAVAPRTGPLREAAAAVEGGGWIAVGYGDAAFYQGRGVGLARAADLARAVLKPGNPSVLHVQPVDRPDAVRAEDHVLVVAVTPAQMESLLARVDGSFALKGGRPRLASAPSDNGVFYVGAEPASALHDCNAWMAETLTAVGLPRGGPVITSGGLARQLLRSPRVRHVR